MTGNLADVSLVTLPREVVDKTQAHLRARGRSGLEGMALWAGVLDGDRFDIRADIIPEQQGHRTAHGLAVTVEGKELHRINMWLYRQGLRLFAQIHSHPTEAYHSDTDDRYAMVVAVGCLSLVVPDFAVRPFSLADTAIYRLSPSPWWRFTKTPYWRRLPLEEAEQLIRLEP